MMSSGDGGAKPFYCHVCSQRITCTDESDPFCPICMESFVEEWNPNNPNPSFIPDNEDSSDPEFPFHTLSMLPLFLSGPHRSRPDPDTFDPMAFLHNHLQLLRADGANIQFDFDHPSGQGFRLPANFGDYVLGSGLEQLIQQLADNDPNRHGTPPAAQDAVENLPTITVDDELLNSEINQCAVCQDEFEKSSQVTQMPCKHVYHGDCLIPWLRLHNSCPVCRYELPTDDADYENRARGNDGGGVGGEVVSRIGGSDVGGVSTRPVRRTVRIFLRPPDAGGSAQDGAERGLIWEREN